MQSRSIRRSGQPTCASASRMRAFDRDLIRGRHYGQRSCEPHKQAEHMAAPTNLQTWRKALPTRSRPHMALSGHANGAEQCLLSGAKRTWLKDGVVSAYDAVDGVHSAASKCPRVVASKRTT